MTILGLTLLSGCAAPIEFPASQAPFITGDKLLDQSTPQARLLIYSFGLPPQRISQYCIKGDGLQVFLITRTGQCKEMSWDEAGYGVQIDYSQSQRGIYQFTEFTFDPRANGKITPLDRETLTVKTDGSFSDHTTILLAAEPFTPDRVTELERDAIQAALRDDSNSGDEFDGAVAHLRNIGITHPKEVLAAFNAIGHFADGGFAETLSDCEEELSEIQNGLVSERQSL